MSILYGNDYAQKRINEIEQLLRWAVSNTKYNDLSPRDIVGFIDGNHDSATGIDIVRRVFQDMVNWAMQNYKIGGFVARDYAYSVLFRRTEGYNIPKLRAELNKTGLVRPTLSYEAKLKMTIDALDGLWKNTHENELSMTLLAESLAESGIFSKEDALTFVQKAISSGAIASSREGYLKRE